MAQVKAVKHQVKKKPAAGKTKARPVAKGALRSRPGPKSASKKPVAGKRPSSAAERVAKGVQASAPPSLFYRLNTLLHTVRVIAGYEDQLCTLVHEIRTERSAGPKLVEDLLALIDELPGTDYTDELGAVRSLLPVTGSRKRRSSRKQSAA